MRILGRAGNNPLSPNRPSPCSPRSPKMRQRIVPSPLELNQIFREYSMLDPRLKRDVNFNDYLKILGLKGSSSHGPHTPSNSWEDKRDLQQKINKM